jgi:hypothetical protein
VSVTHPLLNTINRWSSISTWAYVAICLPLDSSDLCLLSTAAAAAASAAASASEVDSGGRHSLLIAYNTALQRHDGRVKCDM